MRLLEQFSALLGTDTTKVPIIFSYRNVRSVAHAFASPDLDTPRLRVAVGFSEPVENAPVRLNRTPKLPGVFFLESREARVLLGDVNTLEPGLLALLAHEEPVLVEAQGMMLYAHQDEFLVVKVEDIGDLYEKLPLLQLPAPPAVDLAFLCPTRRKVAWLETYLHELSQSPAGTDRLAAVGALLRYARPPTPVQVVSFASALNETTTAWLERCPGLERLENRACRQASQLQDGLETIVNTEKPLSSFAEVAESILCERDTLESVWIALKKAGAGKSLSASVQELDIQGKSMLPLLRGLVGNTENPRLREVFWQRPDAWWGQVCKP